MVDLNADVGQIMKGLLGGKKVQAATPNTPKKSGSKYLQPPYQNVVLFCLMTVGLIVAFVMFVYMPKIKGNEEKQVEIERLEGLQAETQNMKAQIIGLENALAQSREHYSELLEKFSNSEDLGELYQAVSELALDYNLVVANLKEIAKPPVAASKKPRITASTTGSTTAVKANKALENVSGIKVDVVLNGWYSNYLKFREELAKKEELLTISKEKIMVGKEHGGKVEVSLQISTYAVDKMIYEQAISEGGE